MNGKEKRRIIAEPWIQLKTQFSGDIMTFNPDASGFSHNVPKEYLRTRDPQLLPPRVGHNWNDQAFRSSQAKPQQLEAEFRGTRYFTSTGNFDNPPPSDLGQTAHQLLQALMKGRGGGSKNNTTNGSSSRFMTLDDKVLRFYAFFNERATEGGAVKYWHRKVTIFFYPADDTVLIQEPRIPNSGLDGGTYLKRQKVKADPRQRELYPDDEFLTINFFNVGDSVRINSTEFFLYDCDVFTREFLTMLGVDVGEPVEAPDDEFMASVKHQQDKMISGKFGILSQNNAGDEAERAARFVRDGGKMIRFYGIFDERNKIEGGTVRKLEVLMFVEDNTISVVERPNTSEACPSLFLSRTWLPKNGSAAKLNELTFKHRVNGQREPDVGGDGFYKEADLSVGMTLNVFGRDVFLYDCDDFTRDFYQSRHRVQLAPPIDVSSALKGPEPVQRRLAAASQTGEAAKSRQVGRPGAQKADTLRFRLRQTTPLNHDDGLRRYILSFYTDTKEMMVQEAALPSLGIASRNILRRQRQKKPRKATTLRNAPGGKRCVSDYADEEAEYYDEADLAVGKRVMVSGTDMTITAMDQHTEAYLSDTVSHVLTDEAVDRLLLALLEFMWSRYGSAVKAFLALDHDRDGMVNQNEFAASLNAFQITDDKDTALRLFKCIAATPERGFLLPEDIMKWMGDEKNEGLQKASLKASDATTQQQEIQDRLVQNKALTELRNRLDSRCMNSTEMFRLASTMPRAYRGRRADIYSLTNPSRDALITPVQLRRCIEEILGASPTVEEMACVLHFFFPDMPEAQYLRQRDDLPDYTMTLKEFQVRYNEMWGISAGNNAKTSVI